jgi:uncharacterized GH25 family protein
MFRLPLAALALAAAVPASAHDLWLQPPTFWIPAGGTVPVSVLVGHGKDRENWGVRSDLIVLLRSTAPDGATTDFMPLIQPGTAAPRVALSFQKEGTHVLAMESSHAKSELEGSKFNAFLEEEGLTPALVHRANTSSSTKAGRELFSRRAKALVRVGSGHQHGRSAATKPVGFSLEIVPEVDPYELTGSQKLPVTVYYDGAVLGGALVKLTNLDADAKPVAAQRTDKAGRTAFSLPKQGRWLVNVVWTKPLADNREADFETTFSSLSFGYPGTAPKHGHSHR